MAITEATDYANTNFPNTSIRDAFRHAYWTALSASDLFVAQNDIIVISTAHEFTNRSENQQAFNSTMDLHNNAIGASINITTGWFPPVPDWDKIREEIMKRYTAGELWIWEGNGSQGESEGILIKSNGEKIFPKDA
jgi:hypothetical protein